MSSQIYYVASLKLAMGNVQLAIIDFANCFMPTASFLLFVKIELTRH